MGLTDAHRRPVAALVALARDLLPDLRGWPVRLGLLLALGLVELACALLLPDLGGDLIDALARRDSSAFRRGLASIAVIGLAGVTLQAGQAGLQNLFSEQLGLRLRDRLVASVIRRDLGFHRRHGTADLVARTLHDTAPLRGAVIGAPVQILLDGLTLALTMVLLCRISLPLAAVAALTAPAGFILGRDTAARLERGTAHLRRRQSGLAGWLQSWFAQPMAVRGLGLEAAAQDRFNRRSGALAATGVRLGWLGARAGVWAGLVAQAPGLSVWGLGGRDVLGGHLSPGRLVAFLAWSIYLQAPLQRLLGLRLAAAGLAPLHARLKPLLEPPLPRRPTGAGAPLARLSDVSFGYGAAFGLTVPRLTIDGPGLFGLCGPNGSGKTTLLHILAGLEHPPLGQVECAEEVSFIPQNPRPLAGTLEENATLFEARPDRERLIRLARATGLEARVEGLAHGWRTRVGARSAEALSGGERQALALTALLWRPAPLLLLDEPTSGLDPAARARLLAALESLRDRHAIVIATHDDDILKRCDRLWRLVPAGDGTSLLHERQSSEDIGENTHDAFEIESRPGAAGDAGPALRAGSGRPHARGRAAGPGDLPL